MNFTVGICSAGRPQVCADKTVRMLIEGGVDPTDITIYVPDEAEWLAYTATTSRVGALCRVEIVSHDPTDKSLPTPAYPARGLATARNGAADHQASLEVPPGVDPFGWGRRWVWWLDDDLEALQRLAWIERADGRTVPRSVPVDDIEGLFFRAGQEADHSIVTLIGILPSQNALTMADDRTLGLSFCIGHCYATRANDPIRGWIAEKDDYERSILHFLKGHGCFRMNDVSARSKVYDGEGGLQLSRTFQRSHAEAQWLIDRYPNLVRLNPRRTLPVTEGRAEILLGTRGRSKHVPRPWDWGDGYS